jgi:hypothetical protein
MPRNQLKHFPTALLRRGLVHVHPSRPPAGRPFAAAPEAPVEGPPPPDTGTERDA